MILEIKEGDFFLQNYSVTKNIYTQFINIFKDRNQLHTDKVFATSKLFDDRVMHGAILAGFLSHFIGECLPIKNVLVQSYKLTFIKPVYMNDALILKTSITGIFPSVKTVEFKYKFINQVNQTVAKGNINISII